MKRMVVVLLLALMPVVSAMAQRTITGSADITGYSNDGVYDVSGAVKVQLIKKVITPIETVLSRTPNATVKINIAGCATPTNGTQAQNSAAGTKRAENVEGFLSKEFQKFPNVTFDAPWSNGSETKTRQVLVQWTIATPSPAAQVHDGKFVVKEVIAVSIVGIVILILTSMLILQLTKKRTRMVPVVLQAKPIVSPSPQKETIRIRRKHDGKWFNTTIVGANVGTKNERWDCVFPQPNQFRKTRARLTDAAKSGLNLLSDAEIQEYLDKKLITVRQEK